MTLTEQMTASTTRPQENPQSPAQSIQTRPEDLPFTLQQLKEAIPPECFARSTWKSLSYLFFDLAIITGLYFIADGIDSWFFWPIFWLMQGTMFWAFFVVGHDCGHNSFSKYKWLNNTIGHLCHTPLLVPFHGWRISHRIHHSNTGSVENDESWHPMTEAQYQKMNLLARFVRFKLVLFLYPFYLFQRPPGKGGSHFLPSSPLFRASEKWDVITSTIACTLMVLMLAFLTYQGGFIWLLKYYLGPYVVFVIWLDLVTFLHHTDPDIPWYRSEEWYFLKGALSTVDRDYGFINTIHHNIGTHVVHHIFHTIPHYHLKTATEAIKPILGQYYRQSNQPFWAAFWRSYNSCYFVANEGSKVYYSGKPRH